MSELTTLFQNTADAIRSKTGDTATMKASQFPAKIMGISVGISQDEADARYLQLSGGTMTGDLKVQESPASAESAVSKSYAQGLFASALPKSGGTMTGDLILNGAPTADNQAATKAYVDSKNADKYITLCTDANFKIQSSESTITLSVNPIEFYPQSIPRFISIIIKGTITSPTDIIFEGSKFITNNGINHINLELSIDKVYWSKPNDKVTPELYIDRDISTTAVLVDNKLTFICSETATATSLTVLLKIGE